jgi:cell division septal protein FtsQ
VKVRKKLIAKRPKVTRAERDHARRFAANVSTGLLVAGAIAGLVMAANKWARKEELRSIRIVGRKILDSAEIMRQAAVPDSVPFAKLDLAAIEDRVESHPFISHAAVYRGENGTLVVEIGERAPAAVTVLNGSPTYIDSLGIALPYRFSSAGFDLPVIGGIGRSAPPKPGDTTARATLQTLDSARTREALALLDSLRDYDMALYRQISEVRREPDGEYTLVMADGGVPVNAGLPADIPSRLRKLDLFMTTVLAARGPGQASSIDLRWKGQVVVRWRGAGAQAGA